MTTYTYEAYWREQGATSWNKITSSSPITWSQELTGGSPYTNGQCDLSKYQVSISVRNRDGGISVLNRIALGPIGGARCFSVTSTNHQVQLLSRGINNSSGATCASSVTAGGSAWRSAGLAGSLYNPSLGATATVVAISACPNQPDDCATAGECKTTFSTGLVVTKPQCIEVTASPPECPCCKELLPKANAILARLS